jgi:hypothetical protein
MVLVSFISDLLWKFNLFPSWLSKSDPLGPAIFSLSIHPIIERFSSHLNVWYLNDGSLGGPPESVLKDLETNKKKIVTQSRTGLQIYEGDDDQLNRPGPMT